jgi:predicted ester cyclase
VETIRQRLGWDAEPETHQQIRRLWIDHELVPAGHRWEGHEGAARFYTQLLTAFPDIHFDLTNIVIGPQGVVEEANVSGTHKADWLGVAPTGERLEWQVVIWFPWDGDRRLFTGERVYVFGLDVPAAT